MALQDLTPQLRTRLSRLERVVGWFVTIATFLLLFGLGYYVYQTAQSRGWFLTKMPYFTFVRNATGLKEGDRVRLMGFDAGEIVEITAMPPEDEYLNVYVRFLVKEPYYGYLWEDSRAKVGAADFLGHRFIEVTKGTNEAPTYALHELKELTLNQAMQLVGSNGIVFAEEIYERSTTNRIVHPSEPLSQEALKKIGDEGLTVIQVINRNLPLKSPKWIWDDKRGRYRPFRKDKKEDKGYWLRVEESPALTERLEGVINAVEGALPDFLGLTNKLTRVLTNAAGILSHADELLVSAKPVVTNFVQITANLSGAKGSLGEWLLPTNVNLQLQTVLASANGTMTTAQTNLNLVSSNLLLSLENVANLTSNLHAQVEGNALILTEISELIVHADEMVQGLKHHWLLKSAFGQGTNRPLESIVKPRIGGGK
jgi:MlaD protein